MVELSGHVLCDVSPTSGSLQRVRDPDLQSILQQDEMLQVRMAHIWHHSWDTESPWPEGVKPARLFSAAARCQQGGGGGCTGALRARTLWEERNLSIIFAPRRSTKFPKLLHLFLWSSSTHHHTAGVRFPSTSITYFDLEKFFVLNLSETMWPPEVDPWETSCMGARGT